MKLIVIYWKHALVLAAGTALRFILHLTQTIAADFEVRAIRWLVERFKRRQNMADPLKFSHKFVEGPATITVSEEGGVAKVHVEVAASLGGGAAAGVVVGKAAIEVDLQAKQLIDLGFALAKAKFPGIATFIDAAQKAVDEALTPTA